MHGQDLPAEGAAPLGGGYFEVNLCAGAQNTFPDKKDCRRMKNSRKAPGKPPKNVVVCGSSDFA